MMTRKDFQELAEMVNRWQDLPFADPAVIEYIASDLATLCQQQNPRFNRDKFYRACGLPEMADN